MGEKVTDFKVYWVDNKNPISLFSIWVANVYMTTPMHIYAPTSPCLCPCPCAYVSVSMRAYGYIRTMTTQQHKYSGYFNICSFSQKKYVVSEWNLRSRKNSKQIIFKCLCDTRLFLFLTLLCFRNKFFKETAFSCSIPNSVHEPCGFIRESVCVSRTHPYSLVFRTTKNEFAFFPINPSFFDKIRLFGVIFTYHCECALMFMSFVDNNTVGRFQRGKQPSDLGTTYSEILHHFGLGYAPPCNSTSIFIVPQHKLVIANISNQITEKISLQFVHEFTEGIILLIIFDNYVTSVWHTNSTHLECFGLWGYCYHIAIFHNLKEGRFECLVKNTTSRCATNTEHFLYCLYRRIAQTATCVIHFYGNKETITIPRTTFIKMFLNGADYNVVNPFLWIYYNIFLCHINSLKGKKKTLTPPSHWHKGFYILAGSHPNNVSLSSHHGRLVTVQKYKLFSNPARNVNSELTFEGTCSDFHCRKIAAMRKSLCHNALRANTLHAYCPKFVVLNVVGSSPTGHPTNKPSDYQVIRGYFCTQNRPNPP